MASSYPGALDTFDPVPATLAGPVTHEELHEQLVNALAAVQSELGTDPAGAYATVKARLDAKEGFEAATSGTVSVANTTFTDLVWATESYDPSGYGAGTATLTVPAGMGGWHVVTVRAVMASAVTPSQTPWIRFLLNGATWDVAVSAAAGYMCATLAAPLSAGHTLKAQLYQASGGAINCTAANIYLRRQGN